MILCQSTEIPALEGDWFWYAITGTRADLDPDRKLPDLGKRLEDVFDSVREEWWALGHKLGQTPSGRLAHMPTAAAYNCDFGLMVAWTLLTREVALEANDCIVVCDDPWVFRQLAGLSDVMVGRPPRLYGKKLKAWLRGWLARGRLVLRAALAHIRLRSTRKNSRRKAPTILVYGHPASNAEGHDAYFGPLLSEIPDLDRLVHTDADVGITLNLAKDGRTAGLHAWGSIFFTPLLLFQRWMPVPSNLEGPYFWILTRAVVVENSTAAPAANRWQMHCQDRWLAAQRPNLVIWPWENHPWERAFCRSAKKYGVTAKGYQHAVIGPHQFNPGPASNPDGMSSIPDRIVCSGPAYHDQLLSWGIPAERLCIGGAFRIAKFENDYYDPAGPVFVATSSIPEITAQMMQAINLARKTGRKFLVKEHPFYPMPVPENDEIRRTNYTIPQSRNISAVFYGTGTSGLEGLLAGVPTFRFRPDDRVAINVLPPCAEAIPVSLATLGLELDRRYSPQKLDWHSVYAPVDMNIWRREISD